MEHDIFVGLDIGTTKIACIISQLAPNGQLNIMGVGVSPSEGLKKGIVVNIKKTVNSIKKAVEEATLMAGVGVDSVWVGITGDHIRSVNSKGIAAISRNNHEITEFDVARAIDSAKAVSIPKDREILHVIPHEFSVDDHHGIKDPTGMCGIRLETQVHICTGAVMSAQNIYRSVNRAGFKVADLVLEPLASCYAVLDKDEKEIGVVLIDIGGGATDIAIYYDESIRHTAIVGLGGNDITSDIARGLRTPIEKAEEIKKRYGCSFSPLVKENEYVNVPGVGGRGEREVPRGELVSIIEQRFREILSRALKEIKETEYAGKLGAGAVLTGGSSLMEGFGELAEEVLEMPVRIGVPSGFGGLTEAAKSPVHATGVGLCMYAMGHSKDKVREKTYSADYSFKRILNKMKSWVSDFI